MSINLFSETKAKQSPAMMGWLMLCLLLLSDIAFAQTGAQGDGAVPGKAGLSALQQQYQSWDTNRVDDQTAQLFVDLSRAYAGRGDKASAYRYFERYRRVKDSILLQAKNVEINKLKQDLAA
ncbi:MAG: hypothetical protein EOP49_38310, partial [Sphingobacteriales bacterium]